MKATDAISRLIQSELETLVANVISSSMQFCGGTNDTIQIPAIDQGLKQIF